MDQLEHYRQLIRTILTEHTKVPFSNSDAKFETVFDRESDRYLLLMLGHEKDRRYTHGCLIHIDIIDGKIWVQRDGTEYGVANELVEGGVPKDQIILGFKSPEMLPYTQFAAA
jgi:hypothetical protein